MLIDWFTVTAQALNFFILVLLLKRFLYKPVLDAIDKREQLIAAELADAEQKRSAALDEKNQFINKNMQFDLQRATLLNKATEDARSECRRLLDEARRAADALRVERQNSLLIEQQQIQSKISRRTQQEIFSIVRDVLIDLADVSLERRMCEVFIKLLTGVEGEVRNDIQEALQSASHSMVSKVEVRSAFALSAEQQAEITRAFNDTFLTSDQLSFSTSPSIISGIELSVSGRKIAWSIAEYLRSLEYIVGDVLKSHGDANPKAATKS